MLHSTATMDDYELTQRRRTRRERIDRSRSRGAAKGGAASFFGSPASAVVCMLVALGSIVGFWRGVPSWALLALGFGAILIIAIAGFFYRKKLSSPDR